MRQARHVKIPGQRRLKVERVVPVAGVEGRLPGNHTPHRRRQTPPALFRGGMADGGPLLRRRRGAHCHRCKLRVVRPADGSPQPADLAFPVLGDVMRMLILDEQLRERQGFLAQALAGCWPPRPRGIPDSDSLAASPDRGLGAGHASCCKAAAAAASSPRAIATSACKASTLRVASGASARRRVRLASSSSSCLQLGRRANQLPGR